MRDIYGKGSLLLSALPFLAIAARLSMSATADVSYLILAFFALFGRIQVVQALFLSWLFTMLSEGVAPIAPYTSISRHVVILAAAASVLCRRRVSTSADGIGIVSWTAAYTTFLIVHSIFVSPLVAVSLLKAVSWSIAIICLLLSWSELGSVGRQELERHIFGGLGLIVLFSLPLVVSNLGYLRNGTGFQGILNHPQAFGPTVALLATYLAARFFEKRLVSWWQLGMLGICCILVILSEARTAGLALVLGLGMSVVAKTLRSKDTQTLARIRTRFACAAAALGLAIVIAGPSLAEPLSEFLAKRGNGSSLSEVYEQSRGAVIYAMLANIERHPIAGIGFGIASNPSLMFVERDPFFNLPVGASIEKGVMPLAILEELGYPGFLVSALWVWALVRRASRGGLLTLAVLTTALSATLGESVFFSPGGMGLILIILIAWACTSPGESTKPASVVRPTRQG